MRSNLLKLVKIVKIVKIVNGIILLTQTVGVVQSILILHFLYLFDTYLTVCALISHKQYLKKQQNVSHPPKLTLNNRI